MKIWVVLFHLPCLATVISFAFIFGFRSGWESVQWSVKLGSSAVSYIAICTCGAFLIFILAYATCWSLSSELIQNGLENSSWGTRVLHFGLNMVCFPSLWIRFYNMWKSSRDLSTCDFRTILLVGVDGRMYIQKWSEKIKCGSTQKLNEKYFYSKAWMESPTNTHPLSANKVDSMSSNMVPTRIVDF